MAEIEGRTADYGGTEQPSCPTTDGMCFWLRENHEPCVGFCSLTEDSDEGRRPVTADTGVTLGDRVSNPGGTPGTVIDVFRPEGDRYVSDGGGDTQDRWLAKLHLDNGNSGWYPVSRLTSSAPS